MKFAHRPAQKLPHAGIQTEQFGHAVELSLGRFKGIEGFAHDRHSPPCKRWSYTILFPIKRQRRGRLRPVAGAPQRDSPQLQTPPADFGDLQSVRFLAEAGRGFFALRGVGPGTGGPDHAQPGRYRDPTGGEFADDERDPCTREKRAVEPMLAVGAQAVPQQGLEGFRLGGSDRGSAMDVADRVGMQERSSFRMREKPAARSVWRRRWILPQESCPATPVRGVFPRLGRIPPALCRGPGRRPFPVAGFRRRALPRPEAAIYIGRVSPPRCFPPCAEKKRGPRWTSTACSIGSTPSARS